MRALQRFSEVPPSVPKGRLFKTYPGGGYAARSLRWNRPTVFVEPISFFIFFFVFLVVMIFTQAFKVVEGQGNPRIVYVFRCQVFLVVNDHDRLHVRKGSRSRFNFFPAAFAISACVFDVGGPCLLPCGRMIEPIRKVFRHYVPAFPFCFRRFSFIIPKLSATR